MWTECDFIVTTPPDPKSLSDIEHNSFLSMCEEFEAVNIIYYVWLKIPNELYY